jgi:sialic acid synthase SpsE
MVERHLTLDRTMTGTDHAASLEPHGFQTMVRDIRAVEAAMGIGMKGLLPCEESARAKLRGSFWRGSCS